MFLPFSSPVLVSPFYFWPFDPFSLSLLDRSVARLLSFILSVLPLPIVEESACMKKVIKLHSASTVIRKQGFLYEGKKKKKERRSQ